MDVIDVVFSVCIVRRSVRVWEVWVFVSCVHPVAVLNTAFSMICSLLILVEDERADHMKATYSRAGLITAL